MRLVSEGMSWGYGGFGQLSFNQQLRIQPKRQVSSKQFNGGQYLLDKEGIQTGEKCFASFCATNMSMRKKYPWVAFVKKRRIFALVFVLTFSISSYFYFLIIYFSIFLFLCSHSIFSGLQSSALVWLRFRKFVLQRGVRGTNRFNNNEERRSKTERNKSWRNDVFGDKNQLENWKIGKKKEKRNKKNTNATFWNIFCWIVKSPISMTDRTRIWYHWDFSCVLIDFFQVQFCQSGQTCCLCCLKRGNIWNISSEVHEFHPKPELNPCLHLRIIYELH